MISSLVHKGVRRNSYVLPWSGSQREYTNITMPLTALLADEPRSSFVLDREVHICVRISKSITTLYPLDKIYEQQKIFNHSGPKLSAKEIEHGK